MNKLLAIILICVGLFSATGSNFICCVNEDRHPTFCIFLDRRNYESANFQCIGYEHSEDCETITQTEDENERSPIPGSLDPEVLSSNCEHYKKRFCQFSVRPLPVSEHQSSERPNNIRVSYTLLTRDEISNSPVNASSEEAFHLDPEQESPVVNEEDRERSSSEEYIEARLNHAVSENNGTINRRRPGSLLLDNSFLSMRDGQRVFRRSSDERSLPMNRQEESSESEVPPMIWGFIENVLPLEESDNEYIPDEEEEAKDNSDGPRKINSRIFKKIKGPKLI
jgi:hypothetical protein